MIKFITLFLLSIFVFPTLGFSGSDHMPVIESSKEFNRLKSLVGSWQGESEMGPEGKPENMHVEYKLTSNKSVILETLAPGTPHEMVSVYHDMNGKLFMTHYCALGNQPIMELKSSDENNIFLDFAAKNNLDPKKEPHMHSLDIVFVNEDTIIENWTHDDGTGERQTHTFKLNRVK